MGEDNFRPLVQLYFDQELDTAKSLEVENHLLMCIECSTEYKRLQDLRAALRGADLRFSAPSGLGTRVARSPKLRRWVPLGLAAAAACFVVIWFAMIARGDQSESKEVVANHVRSLMANHLMDVASTSSHTVKPWLGDHLDFSPPVVDLAERGSPLIGGRLDYLGGRSVAALVYRHGQHTVNVFIAPGSGAHQTTSENGFNVEEWAAGGMRFWAVSDMNPTELRQFADEFREKAR